MEKMKNGDDSAIDVHVPESSTADKGNTAPIATPKENKKSKFKKVLGIFDFLIRLGAIIVALAAAATMGTSNETLPFFTKFFQFQAGYHDLPTFTFFVFAMAAVAGYLVLSLPLSIVTIIRPHLVVIRLLLLFSDTVALTLTMAVGGAAAGIVYLAHKGYPNTNWQAICKQFGDFCAKVSATVVASFITVVVFFLLILLSGVAIKKRKD